MLTVEVKADGVAQALAEARQACLSTRPLMGRLGRRLEKELRGHFFGHWGQRNVNNLSVV